MIHKIKNLIKIPLLLLICSMLFVQCDKDDAAAPVQSLDEVITKSADLTMFKAAVVQAKLETFTKGAGPFTVFAPTDAAFAAAGVTPASLAATDSITLTAAILNHFQSSAVGILTARSSFEIPEGPNAPMTSIAGYPSYSYKDKIADKIFISGAQVIERDIRCGNGIMHKIDRILLPQTATIMASLIGNSDYSLMVQAITKLTLTTNFSPAATAPITVFAIPNSVMTANGYDAVTIAAISGAAATTLSNILKYHIVAGRNFSTDMKAGNLKTTYLIGTTPTYITVSLGTGVSVKGASNPTPFLLNPTNFAATNGVIHSTAGMLKP